MRLTNIQVDHFNIPLPVVLSDSTHGDISHFALVTVRITDEDGAEGLGYTYTVGNIGGSAVASLLRDDLSTVLESCDPRNIEVRVAAHVVAPALRGPGWTGVFRHGRC